MRYLVLLLIAAALPSGAATSPTYNAICAASQSGVIDFAGSGRVFDGAPRRAESEIAPVSLNLTPVQRSGAPLDVSLRNPEVPPPQPVGDVRAAVYDYSMTEDWQWGMVAKAVKTFGGTPSGLETAQYYDNLNLDIIWSNRGFADKTPYAYTLPPGEDGVSRVYLNKHFSGLLMSADDQNFTFLSSVLAHELVHQQDYASLQLKSIPKDTSVDLLLELHALSTEVYVYEQLRQSNKVPAVNNETADLQWIRLYADIFKYVNGGKRPAVADYPQLVKVDGDSLDKYIDRVANKKKRGVLSLLGVVEDLYGFSPSLEAPPQPSAIENSLQSGKYIELIQYNALMKNIEVSFRKFSEWQSSIMPVHPPPAQPVTPQPVHPPHNGGGNNNSGSSSSGGGSHGGGNPPVVLPPNWGGNTGLDNPGAANF